MPFERMDHTLIETVMVETDFGMMAVPVGVDLDAEGIKLMAQWRYKRGENLASISNRRVKKSVRLGNG